MKTSKRVLSLVLTAIMLVTTFAVALPMVKTDAEAADIITLGGISQTRVVSDYQTKYAEYANRFFGGQGKSEATNFVIPGLSSSNDYTPQGMTYWKAKDWILISAYDASGSGKNSVIYALDGKSTEFVALFNVLNEDGSVNTSHGGGIAASEYNFYYADTGSKISYVPLSDMDVPAGTVKEIRLKGSINCAGELNSAYTSYCCYDEGVLWTGNFYFDSSSYDYAQPANASYNSMLLGYRLVGDSSEEEWAYLNGKYTNLLEVNTSSGTSTANGSNLTWKAYKSGDFVDVVGTITAPTSAAVGEYTANFGSFNLTEGKQYIIQYITNVHPSQSDFYMFAPNGGGHMDVKLAKDLKVTDLGDGRWHCSLKFTAGLRPDGTDSLWPTTQSTNGTYTGTYTIRFDQDAIQVGESRQFAFTDVAITEASDHLLDLDNDTRLGYRGNHAGTVGDPTYCVALDNDLNMVQYAMVDNGRIYISRSWSRNDSGNHVRQLVVGEIDLNSQGTIQLNINGKTRYCHYVDDTKMTKFGGSYKNNSEAERNQMLFMGEALCVMEGYLYMFAESAAWTYNGKDSDSYCKEPIDVIWKIDQYAIMGELRESANEKLMYYERVEHGDVFANTSNSLLNTDEYIIVYRSAQKDPVTQKEILYALDAFGGQNGNKLAKNNSAMSENANGYSIGIVGHPITEYSMDGGKLYLNNPEKDDVENIRWKFSGAEGSLDYKVQSVSPYYANYKDLYFNGIKAYMTKDNSSMSIKLVQDAPDGKWYFLVNGTQYLWCNDGYSGYNDTINKYYTDKGVVHTETAGTIHADGLNTIGNVIGGQVSDVAHGQFEIYRRKLDPNTETEVSKVYTSANAELQADGTYTINLETYATAASQYTLLPEQRPTDFIFVLDTSGSMSTEDCNGYHRHDAFDLEAAAGNGDAAGKTNNSSNSGTTATYTGNMWVQHTDGVMCPVSVKVQGDGREYKFPSYVYYQRIYLWYTHPVTGQKYWFHVNSDNTYGTWTTAETTYDQAMRISGSSQNERKGRVVYSGVCYEKRSNSSRMSNMQIAVNNLTYKIQNEAASTGLDHRIAVVQYGSNSSGSWTNMGMYTTTGGTNRVAYTGAGTISAADYQKAFFKTSQFDTVRTIINNLTASGDTFVDYGFDMAQNIISNANGVDGCTGYLAEGNRSACIVMITDGCPGFGGNDSATANTVADAAVVNSYKAKQNGAYVFSVQMGNNSMSGFNMDDYMNYISSEYIGAENMSAPGDRNNNAVDYRMDVDAGSSFDLDSFVSSMFTNVTANSRNALTQLNTSSILRQTLSDNFYAPVGSAKVQYLFADGYYDGLGRIAFKNETDATQTSGIEVDATTQTDANGNEYYKYLDVTGFDYKNYYISKAHEGGKKLIIRITGVLPRATDVNTGEELNLANAAISDDSWTGIYQTEAKRDAKQEFKGFPNARFSIPKYTYVLDYGVAMYDSDVNGTLRSVSAELKAQRDANGNISYKTMSENGLVQITNNSQDLIYYSTPTNYADSGYCLIQRNDGTYDWFEIEVVPASNVLYEENYMEDGTAGAVNWVKDGTTKTAYQSLTNEKTDVYGYDDVYADGSNSHSYGSAYKAAVSSTAKRSTTKTFDFIGEGIDIISACGANTGIMIVKISGGALETPKAYIVDTYYGDGEVSGLLCQTPIVSFRDDYGTYTVEATATYLSTAGALNKKSVTGTDLSNGKLSTTTAVPVDEAAAKAMIADLGIDLGNADLEMVWFDDNSILNGGTGAKGNVKKNRAGTTTTTLDCYLDGFRVYHPMQHADDNYIEKEKTASYINVIDALEKNQYIGSNNSTIDTIGYVTGSFSAGEDGTVPTLSFTNYQNVGPQNEFYLQRNRSENEALILMVGVGGTNSTVQLGLRAVEGTATVKIGGTQFNINSATEMYYDVTELVGDDGTLIIQNVGSGILAVNNVKLTGDVTATALVSEEALEAASFAMATPARSVAVINGVVTPDVEDDTTTPDDGNDTTGDNTTTGGSFIEQLIAMIMEIIRSLFAFLPVGEVM